MCLPNAFPPKSRRLSSTEGLATFPSPFLLLTDALFLFLVLSSLFSSSAFANKPAPAPSLRLRIPSPQDLGEDADTITLQQALEQSSKANLHLARARALVEAAQAQEFTQSLRWIPSLELRVDGYLRGGHSQGNFGDESDLKNPLYQIAPLLQISYALHPAKLYLQQQAAAQKTAASRFQQTHVQDAVLLATALAYQSIAEQQVQIALVDQSIAALNQVMQIALARLRAGVGSQAEVLQVQSHLEQDLQDKFSVLYRLRKRSAHFSLLLGRSSQRPLYPKESFFSPLSFSPPFPSQPADKLVHRHPVLQKQDAQIKALSYLQQSIVLGPWIPSLHFQLTGGLFEAGVLQQVDRLPLGPQYSALLSAKWSFSFEDLGRSQEVIAQKKAQRRSREASKLMLETQARLAFQRVYIAAQRMQAAQRFALVAEQALALTQIRYKTGAGSLLEVLSTQRALLRASVIWLRSIADHNRAQFLLRALPGHLQPTSLVPSPP